MRNIYWIILFSSAECTTQRTQIAEKGALESEHFPWAGLLLNAVNFYWFMKTENFQIVHNVMLLYLSHPKGGLK